MQSKRYCQDCRTGKVELIAELRPHCGNPQCVWWTCTECHGFGIPGAHWHPGTD